MKIVVYNYQHQFALSRKQIELIQSILPKEYFSPIREFHITTGSPGQERFEYDYITKTAHFEYKVDQKTDETTMEAIEHLLVGLKRIKDKDAFGYWIKDSKKEEYRPFVQQWKDKCLVEFEKLRSK